ncbi:FUSC family protein [Longimicrobium sp.]|uniref:FUSC family protein n=1 Tax=Longimicrobium sp. TaxID=2029185 RepID=UPI002D7E46CD|nr:FUSC family protein [Longimicrobium sp.]
MRELARFGGRPNLGAGLRAAVATVVPMAAAAALDIPGATWLGLAGFVVAIADKGGAYRTRARIMGALTLATALAGVLGGLASGRPALSIPLIFAWALGGALLRAFGAGPGSIGTSSTITFIISLSAPAAGLDAALGRGGFLLIGGALAMALSLFLWPIRAYRPARVALAACYRALAGYADAVATGAPRDFGGFRGALEAARDTLAQTRRGRPGESGRGERLLMLAEAADRTFAATTALGGVADAEPVDDAEAAAQERARATAAAAARLARELADAVERERTPGPPPTFPEQGGGDESLLARLTASLRREAMRAWEAAAGVESGKPVRLPESPPAPSPAIGEVLRENLTFRSVTLRHALRVGVTAAAATALAHYLGVQRGYWVTLTALIVLQPSAGATWVKGLQRIGGTMAGGIAAAAIGALVHDPHALLAIIFVLACATASMLQVNYAVYSALLTPTFVLLAETSAPDRHLPMIRIANTLIGGALALAAARLLWPAPERLAFRGRLAEALRACGAYLRVAARRYAGAATRAEADAARRNTGLAVLNAEESLQVVLWEGRRGHAPEAGMAALAYLRRLGEAANALAYAPAGPGGAAPEVVAFGDTAAHALDGLAAVSEELADAVALEEIHPPSTPDAAVNQRLAITADVITALERVLARGMREIGESRGEADG